MNALVNALTTIVSTLVSTRKLVVRIGGAHVNHVKETNVVLNAIRTKIGRTNFVHIRNLESHYPGIGALLSDSYLLENALILNGRMETLDVSTLVDSSYDYSVLSAIENKLLVNRWDVYLYLHNPDDYTGGFPDSGIWITGN